MTTDMQNPGAVTLEIHSRSRLAGYEPGKLAAARVTIVGLGALGQNILQTLALSGVGSFLLIDCDHFEDHNATRSPFFPTAAEVAALGARKAPVVAHRALTVCTAESPRILFHDNLVQRCGDSVVTWADVIVSAVDSVSARAWLAERARLHSKPLVEGGFFAAEFNFSAFSTEADADCYRCLNPTKTSSASCRQYALDAERQNIVPAIQATAAVLGGLMAEQVISILHGAGNIYGRRYYGNIRKATMHSALLRPDPECPGKHRPLPVRKLHADPAGQRTISDLLTAVRAQQPEGWLALAEPVILALSCTSCEARCRVQAAESSWLRDPHCQDCGGPWPVTTEAWPGMVHQFALQYPADTASGPVELAKIGLGPGGCVLIDPGTEPPYLLKMPGIPAFSEVG